MLNLDGPRRRVEARIMGDTCTITREKNQYAKGTMNPTSLEVTKDAPAPVYSGKCFVVPTGLQAQAQDVAGSAAAQKAYLCSLPYDEEGKIKPGDIVTMDTSQDPQLVGSRFRVRDVVLTSALVMRQFNMEQLETARA